MGKGGLTATMSPTSAGQRRSVTRMRWPSPHPTVAAPHSPRSPAAAHTKQEARARWRGPGGKLRVARLGPCRTTQGVGWVRVGLAVGKPSSIKVQAEGSGTFDGGVPSFSSNRLTMSMPDSTSPVTIQPFKPRTCTHTVVPCLRAPNATGTHAQRGQASHTHDKPAKKTHQTPRACRPGAPLRRR